MSRRSLRAIFLTMLTIAFAAGTVVAVWAKWDDDRGGRARAEIVAVEPDQTHRRVYTVTFVTDTGLRCRSEVITGFTRSQVAQPRVGDLVDVHYRRTQPCTLVREAGDSGLIWPIVVLSVCLLVIGSIAYVAWRPPPPVVRPRDEPERPRGTG